MNTNSTIAKAARYYALFSCFAWIDSGTWIKMCPSQSTDLPEAHRRFNTTRWSVILASADAHTGDQKAAEALAQLCRIYWRPIFAFVARRLQSQEDAEDLTQDFFVMVLT